MLRSFTRALDVAGFPGSDGSKLAMRPLSFPQKPDLTSTQSVSDLGGLEQEAEEAEAAAAFPDQIYPPAQVTTSRQPVAIAEPSTSANGFLRDRRMPGKGPIVPLPQLPAPSASEPTPPPRRPPPVYQGEQSASRSRLHYDVTRRRSDLPDLDSWYRNPDSFLNMEMETEHSSPPGVSDRTLLNSVNYDESFPIASTSHSITEVPPSGSTRMVSQLPDALSIIRTVEVPPSDASDSSESAACAESEHSGNQNFVRQLWSFIKTGTKSQTPSRLGTPKSSSPSIQAPSVNSAVSGLPDQDASGSGQVSMDYLEEAYPYRRRERTFSYYVSEPSAKEGSVYTALSISFPSWLCCCPRRNNGEERDEFH